MKSKIKYIFIIITVLVLVLISYCIYKSYNSRIYILNLESENKHLFFYGSMHSNDKNDAMFKDIEEKFYRTNPQIVLVEGDANKREYYNNADNAIARGESAYVAFLAQNENILLKSVEPSQKEQYEYLLQKYEKERVLMMYILRQTDQYQKQNDNNPINYEQEIQRFVYYMIKEGFPIADDEIKIDNILSLLQQYTKQIVDNNNWLELDVKAFVFRDNTEFNGIYNDLLTFRNNYLVLSIEEVLNKHDRVFVVMGGGHVKEERKRIEEIFDSIID